MSDATPRESGLPDVGRETFFRSRDRHSLGLNFRNLNRLIEDGEVERVTRGLYRLRSAEPTAHHTIAAVCARVPTAIVCLLSALQVHELGTQLPREVWIAIPHKARAPRLPELPTRIVRFSGPLLRYGIQPIQLEGVPARVTSPARTIVDCFRFRRLVTRSVAHEALREALRDRKATVDEIWRAAEVCRARSLVEPHLEALAG